MKHTRMVYRISTISENSAQRQSLDSKNKKKQGKKKYASLKKQVFFYANTVKIWSKHKLRFLFA